MSFRSNLILALLTAPAAFAQEPAQTAAPTVFRTETRIVPVDVVVQDKKGNYIHDLEQKDFKIWEDNKEQQIRNFSFEADPASPLAQQKKYLVLFFDLASMNPGDQIQARQAAAKFIDSTAGPNRLMAIANFGGSLQIAQNFTDDIERLKQAASGVKQSSVTTASAGGPRLGGFAQFGMRSMVEALRGLARNLGDIPGRKSLILFSAGFPLNEELRSEVAAAVDACNHANVAIYAVDVRGLTTNMMPFDPRRGAVLSPGALRDAGLALAAWPVLRAAALFAPQRGGGASGTATPPGAGAAGPGGGGGGVNRGGGGAMPGAGSGGNPSGVPRGGPSSGGGPASRGTSPDGGAVGRNPSNNPGNNAGGGSNPNSGRGNNPMDNRNMRNPNDPFNRRMILPRIESASTNQEVLFSLANGTGGFVIMNTNDLLGSLERIGKEQNEYYLLAYNPPESPEGSCHLIKVKVNKGGYNVRARSGYCNVKPRDLLSGKPVEKEMETLAAGAQPGTIHASPMQLPYFYTAGNTARVHVVMEIPMSSVKFEKVKGKQHAEINVLGIASRSDGGVAARFSDVVKRDFDDKKEAEKFTKEPLRYENQFDLGSGEYTLKVVFTSAGAGFGKQEAPLKIDPYDPAQFSMSGLALSSSFRRLGPDTGIDQELVEGRTPLITGGIQFDPAGAVQFKTTEKVLVYFEVYDPLLENQATQPVKLGAVLRIVDRSGGAEKMNSGTVEVSNFIRAGNPVAPVGMRVPVETLSAGAYRLEVKALDSAGRSWTRSADFDVQ